MKKLYLYLILLVFSIIPFHVFASESANLHVTGSTNYDYIHEVFEIVNKERADNNLEPLVMDAELTEAAILRAKEIVFYFDHTRANGEKCYTVSERMYGENIAAGMGLNDTPEKVMVSWMNSSGHRANILREEFQTIGIGHFQIGRFHFWAQAFGYDDYEDPFTLTGSSGENTTEITVSSDYVNYEITFDGNDMEVGEVRSPSNINFINMDWDYAVTKLPPSDVVWKSSNEKVFKVDHNGVVTALKGGSATLTASIAGVEKTFPVTVKGETALLGDFSGDTDVNFTDVIVGLRKVFGYVSKTDKDVEVGDLNHSGELDFTDIIILLRYVFGYIDTLS